MGRKKYQLDFALRFWPLTRLAKRLGRVAPFRRMAGLVASEKAFKGSFIPVGESIEIPPGVAPPREILEDVIRRSGARAIVRECPCRKGHGCLDHPVDLGCLILGKASLDVDPSVGYQATAEEALAHLDRALSSGLLPLLGHLRIDKVIFGLSDFDRFLTMCFCCRCCCVVRSGMRNLVGAYPASLVRLEGVFVEVGEGCVGCGECVPVCPVENIAVEGGRAVMGAMCLGCGTCAAACSRQHITVTVRPGSSPVSEFRRRVESGVDIG